MICPTHGTDMQKGKFSPFCIDCVDPKGRASHNCLKAMNTQRNKWLKKKNWMWHTNGGIMGKRNPAKKGRGTRRKSKRRGM